MDSLEERNDEYETPAQVYSRLIELISNESESPELLPYEEAVIDCVVEQIEHMNDNMKRLADRLEPFCAEQHKCELERHSYAVNSYLRTRIEKIETNAVPLIQALRSDRKRVERLMSANEIKYLDNYVAGIDAHLNQSVLGGLPFARTAVMNFKLIDVPNNESNLFDSKYVFVRALNATHVIVDDNTGQQTVELQKDSQHFLPYSAVRRHLISGSRDLLLI